MWNDVSQLAGTLKQPALWLLSVVVTGLVLNVAATYLREWLDRKVRLRTEKSSLRRQELERRCEAVAQRFQSDSARQIALELLGIEYLVRAGIGLLIGFVILLAGLQVSILGRPFSGVLAGFLVPIVTYLFAFIGAVLMLQGFRRLARADTYFDRSRIPDDEVDEQSSEK